MNAVIPPEKHTSTSRHEGSATQTEAHAVFSRVLNQAEADEALLSYTDNTQTELERKQTGAYYTPVDVAEYFWNQFFEGLSIHTPDAAAKFIQTHTLIEPSAGSGVLIFALLKKLSGLGVPTDALSDLDLHVIDINDAALEYIKKQTETINHALGPHVITPTLRHEDFLAYNTGAIERPAVFFGNPPFVTNPRGSLWKNTYADFLMHALTGDHQTAAIHFIVPLSLAFSRDYTRLRGTLRDHRYTVLASHFDNIPDTLFKAGKPKSGNTNKANSQRCTILSAYASDHSRILSTPLQRWNTAHRRATLGRLPRYTDVTAYRFDDQFLRPASDEIADYLQRPAYKYSLEDLTSTSGTRQLHTATVARNFIPVRDAPGRGCHSFSFDDDDHFYKFLGLLVSDIFFDYWRSVGDGFHLTRSTITRFPVSEALDDAISLALPEVKTFWRNRKKYQKTKRNSGALVHSYDFNDVAPFLRFWFSQHLSTHNEKGENA